MDFNFAAVDLITALKNQNIFLHSDTHTLVLFALMLSFSCMRLKTPLTQGSLIQYDELC